MLVFRAFTAIGIFVTFFAVPLAANAQDAKNTFKVSGTPIEVDPEVAKYWKFSDFKITNQDDLIFLEGLATHLGGKPAGKASALWRVHCFDANGVSIYKGDPDDDEFAKGEKTKFQVFMGEKADQVKKMKIKFRN
jgi:hypothetical protein